MIDRAHLEQWADMQSAKGDFPELIRRLVFASAAPFLSKCDIPYGSAVYTGGWDGEIDATQQTEYIPQGKSLLEFGTNKDVQSKADNDYLKRSLEGIPNSSEMTFIFMTPRVWKRKEEWANVKKAEGIWKDVRVYDSTVLAQWIISVPSVELWFASLVGMQSSGLIMGEEFLEELLTGQDIKLQPSFYTVGREKIARELIEKLKAPTLMAYRASSKEEALGFILSVGHLFPKAQREEYYAKTIVVEDISQFRSARMQTSMVNLVPVFEDTTVLYRAVSQGKNVFVPLGPGDDFNQLVVELPGADRFGLEQSLIESGIEENKARRIVKDCSCNLTMIKKTLGFPIRRVDWLKEEDVKEIVPALIVGRWNEIYTGDKEVMSSLSGIPYDDFKASIIRWSRKPVPPVINVGGLWRITSPLSLWSDLSSVIKKKDLECLEVLSERVLTGDEKSYSHQLRQGILNTLVILSWHGEQLIGTEFPGQGYTNNIIRNLISNADAYRWRIIANYLPLIAETAPSEFVKAINKSLACKDAAIMSLFKEEDGLWKPESKYPYLLWALEGLAWLPDRLLEVSELLLKFSEKDLEVRLVNSPLRSLVNVFSPWMPHTTASFDDRLSVLHELRVKGYAQMWDLLLALLPKKGSFIFDTYQLKWRGYDLNIPRGATSAEIGKHVEFVCAELKSCYDGTDLHMVELIDSVWYIPLDIRRTMVSWIKDTVLSMRRPLPKTRKKLREILCLQKKLGGSNPVLMTKLELEDVRLVFNTLIPNDIVERDKWLFDEFAPRFSEMEDGNKEDDYAEQKECNRQRNMAVAGWLKSLPLEDVVSVRKIVNRPYEFGLTLGRFYETEGLNEMVFKLLLDTKEEAFVCGYIRGMESLRGEDEIIKCLEKAKFCFSDAEFAIFLHHLVPSRKLFSFIETACERVQKEYWIKYSYGLFGNFDDTSMYVLNNLMAVGRSLDVLTESSCMVKDMPTELLQNLLLDSLKCSSDINGPIDVSAFESYLEELHKRSDADQDKLLALEWIFVPLIRDAYCEDIAILLFKKIQKEPKFFVELLTYFYGPETEVEDAVNEKEEDKRVENDNFIRAFYLFHKWQLIPGMDENGVIDSAELWGWIDEALRLAKGLDRVKFVYVQLGQVFAKFPEDNPNWPPKKMFAIMEALNSEILYENYSIEMFNKRGFTARGGYDGGDIERNNAVYFENLAHQCLPLYPNVANVFKDLAEKYRYMAKEMDNHSIIARLDY